jgi:hypothetical protein
MRKSKAVPALNKLPADHPVWAKIEAFLAETDAQPEPAPEPPVSPALMLDRWSSAILDDSGLELIKRAGHTNRVLGWELLQALDHLTRLQDSARKMIYSARQSPMTEANESEMRA